MGGAVAPLSVAWLFETVLPRTLRLNKDPGDTLSRYRHNTDTSDGWQHHDGCSMKHYRELQRARGHLSNHGATREHRKTASAVWGCGHHYHLIPVPPNRDQRCSSHQLRVGGSQQAALLGLFA